MGYAALGLIACSLVGTPGIALKIASGGFILGQLLFVGPIYYNAINGRNPHLRYVIPAGGVGMITGWFSLIFA